MKADTVFVPRKRRKGRSPAQTELVIGLVGAVGIDLAGVARLLASILAEFDYTCHDIHLSEQLQALDWKVALKDAPADERIWSHMSGGNKLRKRWGRDDAFGFLAINAITLKRAEQTGSITEPGDRHAYVLRSLKRKEEAQLLREVYGSRFVQLSVYAPEKERIAHLRQQIVESRVRPFRRKPKYNAKRLVRRDHSEAIAHGQDVQGIFHRGDFFVDASGDLRRQLKRTVEVLFGHPNRSPSRDEIGMFYAEAASRRSAELGRQVGAAICTSDGSVLAMGTNEVPRAGGGLYWEGDRPDGREFQLGFDTNDVRKGKIADHVARDLIDRGWIKSTVPRRDLVARIANTEIDDLIEFVRAVHAEMAAITDAARRGIPIGSSVLYATTFPCHHCARHIVAAGVKRVVYVAPYAKSLASQLHRDAIIIDPPHHKVSRRRVSFEPFVGVGPRRFLELFEMGERKNKETGQATKFKPKRALPRLREMEPVDLVPDLLGYIRREARALELFGTVQEDHALRLKGF